MQQLRSGGPQRQRTMWPPTAQRWTAVLSGCSCWSYCQSLQNVRTAPAAMTITTSVCMRTH